MLAYFRKKQKRLVTGILVLFLGGWLSIVCQHCQATAAIDNSLAGQESEDHCKNEQNPQQPIDTSAIDSGCIGNCDHDNIATITADISQAAVEKFSKSYLSDDFIYYRKNILASFSRSSNPQHRHSITPERACYLPLDRFCVQLK